jgi:trehalose 6-phosphate synthase
MSKKKELVDLLKTKLKDYKLYVVSNREPYIHKYKDETIEVIRPASGLVTALDPVLKASQGVWIAHGSGEADKDVVDKNDRVKVPPDNPSYHLRRVWLSKKQEDGYYYGFANSSLWPLSHIVYVRPTFNPNHWNEYVKVNEKFARALVDEVGGGKALIWIQDYHLALAPKFIKEKNPDLITGHFWHIPWPNPEAFRICPWKKEILQGLLANDLLGFHIKYHCDNFLDTVDGNLESKISREASTVDIKGHQTLVKPFPTSIDFEGLAERAKSPLVIAKEKEIKRKIRKPYEFMAIGLDRLDYTKGIPERLKAIDLFLEKYPEYKNRFVYVGLGAPTRTHIKIYRDVIDEIESLAEEINWKHRIDSWQPIIPRHEHISYEEILAYYKEANLCIVSSLHDGMNLVAKEFVAVQSQSKKGMLILSQFAGAARELEDAILTNPYDVEGFADSIKRALEMSRDDRESRMKKLADQIRENDIYAWALSFISDLAKLQK